MGSEGHFTIKDDLLLYDDRIVVPQQLQLEILDIIHQGHLGVTKCGARARTSVWWPGMSTQIEQMVKNCVTCAKVRPEPKEPLISSAFPQRPWEKIAMDLFSYKSSTFLIVVDYYSRWLECKKLEEQSSTSVITILKRIFTTHGIPEIVISDNGPQFAAKEFQTFSREYNFTHITSSPRYPQANGEAERAVQTMKRIMKKNEDPYIALLSYHTTPLENGLSPGELLMGRKLRTILPILPKKLLPGIPESAIQKAQGKEEERRTKTEENFNRRHRAKTLIPIQTGEKVWIRDLDREATVVESDGNRSYTLDTPKGTVRRNRRALVATSTVPTEKPAEKENDQQPTSEMCEPDVLTKETRTRSGRVVVKPRRLIEEGQ